MRERKRFVVETDSVKHAEFKSRTASESLTMVQVVSWMVDDYLSGKWKPGSRRLRKGKYVRQDLV